MAGPVFPWRDGNQFELLIDGLSHEGRGLSRVDGKRIFVENALPGETVLAKYSFIHKKYDEARTLDALDQNADRAVRHLEKLEHLRDHADVVKLVVGRIVGARIELREKEDVLVALHRGLERGDRFLATDEQGNHLAREDHNVAKGEKGKKLVHG